MNPWTKDQIEAINKSIIKYNNDYKGSTEKPIFMYKKGENCIFEITPKSKVSEFESLGYLVVYNKLDAINPDQWGKVIGDYMDKEEIPVFTLWVDANHSATLNKTKLHKNLK